MVEINKANQFGKIHISEDVLAVIAGTAALESEGVKGAIGNMAGEIVKKFGVKNFSSGVKISFVKNKTVVDLALVIKSGYKITDVTADVQQKVKTALETMTGIEVDKVNVSVQGLSMEIAKQGTE